MFSGDKLCRKKILLICSFLVFSFSVLFSLFSSSPAHATSINIRAFDVRMSTGGEYAWQDSISYNQYITDNNVPPTYVNAYQFYTSNVNVTGNYAMIHFETNLVFSGPTAMPYIGSFVNTSYINMIVCSSSTSGSLSIRQSHINTTETAWTGPAPTINGKNKTLTVYGDVVLGGLTTGTQSIICMVGSNQYAFYSATNATKPNFYIEQQPTSIDFTSDESEALLRDQIDAINNVNVSINNIESGNQQRYEDEIDREEAKQEELEDSVDDLSLSTPVTVNPFSDLFYNFEHSCFATTYIHYLFNVPAIRFCSPYPQIVRQIFTLITSFIFAGILIRLYYKHLKGGING